MLLAATGYHLVICSKHVRALPPQILDKYREVYDDVSGDIGLDYIMYSL